MVKYTAISFTSTFCVCIPKLCNRQKSKNIGAFVTFFNTTTDGVLPYPTLVYYTFFFVSLLHKVTVMR